jgi:hypothetical protein
MRTVTARAARWPLALTLMALGALSACSDEPVAPKSSSTPDPKAATLAGQDIQVTVTNASGGTQTGSLRWAAGQINQTGVTGGEIVFDASLEGDTITLDAPLEINRPTAIYGPAKGITFSGKDQHRVINAGTRLFLRNVTLTKGNAEYGSAVWAVSLFMHHSTVQDNRGTGSAMFVEDALHIANSTISRNVVGKPAVEYGASAQVMIENSTIAFNAPAAGLGPYGYPSSLLKVTLHNAIISNNGSPQLNCSNYYGFVYQGTNISSDWSCGEVGLTIADPLLMPLANNGGPNMTHAIPHTSPAYNKGTLCWVEVDQRNVRRDAKCDVGAFEFNDFTKVTITFDPTVKVDPANGRALLTGTVKCSRDETFRLALELRQSQKVGKKVIEVHAASSPQVSCGPTAQPWSSQMVLTEGAWQNGAARATAQTFDTPEWVAPASAASAVKIARK